MKGFFTLVHHTPEIHFREFFVEKYGVQYGTAYILHTKALKEQIYLYVWKLQ